MLFSPAKYFVQGDVSLGFLSLILIAATFCGSIVCSLTVGWSLRIRSLSLLGLAPYSLCDLDPRAILQRLGSD